MIADHYAPFLPRPWFIGEMGFNGASASDITTQLTEMNEYTSEGKGFLGSYMFQFQTAYEKTGSELNFGMFSLGGETLFEAGVVEGSTYDVRCLTSRLYAFDSDTSGCPACNHRAEASGCCFWRHSLGHWSLPRYAASWSRRWCVHATGPGSLSDWGTRALLSWEPKDVGGLSLPVSGITDARACYAITNASACSKTNPRRLQQRARQQAKIRGRLVSSLLVVLEVRRCSWEQGPEHFTCASLLPFSKWFSCSSYCLSSFFYASSTK